MSISDLENSPVKVPSKQPITEEVVKKPRKLIALQYNYSDSEDDETREERKARIVSNLDWNNFFVLPHFYSYSDVHK